MQLGAGTNPAESRFEGWVEEVDSCTNLRFRSAEELLTFLGQRFNLAKASADKDRASNRNEQITPGRKSSTKESG